VDQLGRLGLLMTVKPRRARAKRKEPKKGDAMGPFKTVVGQQTDERGEGLGATRSQSCDQFRGKKDSDTRKLERGGKKGKRLGGFGSGEGRREGTRPIARG